ncbi:MAG: CbiX/SirB N-terminal domain-containing protein [Halolamina sp.]
MTDDALLLIGRETAYGDDFETQATRLADRGTAETVRTLTYETEPVRELRAELAAVEADRTFAMPMTVAHSRATAEDLAAALRAVPGAVRYCEPVGRSPAVTTALRERATAAAPEATSLVLVAFGDSALPHQRRTAEYQATRLRASDRFTEVHACYLLQNPTAECARYNVDDDGAVAVPLFLGRCEATERRVPEALELDRGGVDYADPLADHPRVTDAIDAEVQRQRALAAVDGDGRGGLDDRSAPRPLAADGEGSRRDET